MIVNQEVPLVDCHNPTVLAAASTSTCCRKRSSLPKTLKNVLPTENHWVLYVGFFCYLQLETTDYLKR